MHSLYTVSSNGDVITTSLITLKEALDIKEKLNEQSNNSVRINVVLESLIGKSIRLTKMDNDPLPIPVGSIGKVYHVSGTYERDCQICVEWEINRSLNLSFPEDEFEIIS